MSFFIYLFGVLRAFNTVQVICHCGLAGNTGAQRMWVQTQVYSQIHNGSNDHLNGGPLSLGPIPTGRLKNLKDVDKWSVQSMFSWMGQIAL